MMYTLRLLVYFLVLLCSTLMSGCFGQQTLLRKLLNISSTNSCVTNTGEMGFCTKVCDRYFEAVMYSKEANCHENPMNVSFVCCPLSRRKSQNDGTRQKRKTDSSEPPNLRIKGCGVQESLTDLIIGGREAKHWPWMAAIHDRRRNDNRVICGGTVISKHFILTAAHCLVQGAKITPPSSIMVSVGSVDSSQGVTFPVSEVIVHKNYSTVLHYDDIALLRTSDDIEVKNVAPACLPSPGMFNANFYKRNGVVIGWGDVTFAGSPSQVLREATVPVISNKVCARRYRRLQAFSLPRGITDTQMCAGLDDGSADACQGDSGGPLLVKDQGGKWNVVGVVSFGYGCGHPDYPGVYTRVAKYLYWLRDNTDIPIRN